MFKYANYYQKENGNHWYLHELLSGKGQSLLNKIGGKIDFDMSSPEDKALSLNVCTPISTVIDRVGKMFSNGRYYIVDKDGNESNDNNDIINLLSKPNLLQNRKQFLKQVEMCLKLFGYCPIFLLRSTKKSLPKQMWIIPPELFHMISSGKLFKQTKLEEIIGRAYVDIEGKELDLNPEEYIVIFDSEISVFNNDSEIIFKSSTDSLSFPVSNWMAQATASNTLIVDGGPKGIIHNKDTSDFQNAALTPGEKNSLEEKFKGKYGLVNKMFSILITKANIGWIPLNYDSGQLKLHEEDTRCSDAIANAIGADPDMFSSSSKYENKEASERKTYQDLIIPDSELVTEALTNALCPIGIFIKLDYSHVSCLQKDKQAESTALLRASNAITTLINNNLITQNEARIELARYIDINPDKPKGDFKNGMQE